MRLIIGHSNDQSETDGDGRQPGPEQPRRLAAGRPLCRCQQQASEDAAERDGDCRQCAHQTHVGIVRVVTVRCPLAGKKTKVEVVRQIPALLIAAANSLRHRCYYHGRRIGTHLTGQLLDHSRFQP